MTNETGLKNPLLSQNGMFEITLKGFISKI